MPKSKDEQANLHKKKIQSLRRSTRRRVRNLRKRGVEIDFNLSTEYITKLYHSIDECPACGVDFVDGQNSTRRRTLDRIFPKKGYIEGNVQILCDECNVAKSRENTIYVDVTKF